MTERNNIQTNGNEAVLSNAEGFTAFSYGGYRLRVRGEISLLPGMLSELIAKYTGLTIEQIADL